MDHRREIDGTLTITLSDGRRFILNEDDGVLVVASVDGDLILRPVKADTVEIDTPFE